MAKICVDCKKFVPTSTTVCPMCGNTKLVFANSPITPQKLTPTVAKSQKKKQSILPIIIFLILVSGIIIGIPTALFFIDPCRDGHTWMPATCTEAKTCSVCGRIDGNSLGHDWKGATCTTPGICSRCGKEGYTKSHQYSKGFCTSCGRIEEFYTSTEATDGDDYFAAIVAAKIVVKDKLKSPSRIRYNKLRK